MNRNRRRWIPLAHVLLLWSFPPIRAGEKAAHFPDPGYDRALRLLDEMNEEFDAMLSVYEDAARDDLVLEAEAAELEEGRKSRHSRGYTGCGYVTDAEEIAWKVRVQETGRYRVTFRYAHGKDSDRPMQIRVNGKTVRERVSCPPTGGWDRWKEVSLVVHLKAGTRLIEARSRNFAHIDHLRLNRV